MLSKINLIENIGKFEKTSLQKAIRWSFITFIYAENGSGKTTLSSILRSVSRKEASFIETRRRLNGGPPRVSLEIGGNKHVFKDGSWCSKAENIEIFDDVFIDENLYSGLSPDLQQRKNMHDIVLGDRCVKALAELTSAENEFEKQEEILQHKTNAVAGISKPAGLEVKDLCGAKANKQIDVEISACQAKLKTALSYKEARAKKFAPVFLPPFDMNKIKSVLQKDLQLVQSDSLVEALAHIDSLGLGGKEWIEEGRHYFERLSSESEKSPCPFCKEPISSTSIVRQFKECFDDGCEALKEEIKATIDEIEKDHSDVACQRFENQSEKIFDVCDYWKDLLPGLLRIELNCEAIIKNWKETREAVLDVMRLKSRSPFDAQHISEELRKSLAEFAENQRGIKELSIKMAKNNGRIDAWLQKSTPEDLQEIKQTIEQLQCQRNRHSQPEIKKICDEWEQANESAQLAKKNMKTAEKQLSKEIKETYSGMEKSMNKHLANFNTGFRLHGVKCSGKGENLKANYQIEICGKPIGLQSKEKDPSFKTALSAGDRSALALAFFLSQIDSQPEEDLTKKIIVFDDPMTSMDTQRTQETIRLISELSRRVSQVIVLSHSGAFLCALHAVAKKLYFEDKAGREKENPTYILAPVDETTSEIREWAIKQHCMPDNHIRRQTVKKYINKPDPASYSIAGQCLRPILEHCVSSIFADHQEPGEEDYKFAERAVNDRILLDDDALEFRQIKNYASRFHHNNTSSLRDVNHAELIRFCKRTLAFFPKKEEPENSTSSSKTEKRNQKPD